MATLYKAASVLPRAGVRLKGGAVVVEDGQIGWVGPAGRAPAVARTVDLGKATLMPGLVNAHSHLELTNLRDRVPYGDSFAEWLEGVARSRTPSGRLAAVEKGIRDALKRGTTAFGDIVPPGSFEDVVAAFAETGARARLYVEALGFHPDRADGIFEQVWELVEMQQLPPNVSTGISPHAPYTVSRPLLSRLCAVADGHGRPLAVHVAETLEEMAFLRMAMGPLRELLRRFDADDPEHEPYGSAADFLAEVQVHNTPLVLVHANYLRPRDVPRSAFVVYCPTAHAFFKHPEHPALEFIEEGVRVAIGSDSAASGPSVDVLSELRHVARARPDFDAVTLFRMATEWGAQALGLDAGVLEAGRLADLCAFEGEGGPEVMTQSDPESRCVLTVVGGRVLHRLDAA